MLSRAKFNSKSWNIHKILEMKFHQAKCHYLSKMTVNGNYFRKRNRNYYYRLLYISKFEGTTKLKVVHFELFYSNFMIKILKVVKPFLLLFQGNAY